MQSAIHPRWTLSLVALALSACTPSAPVSEMAPAVASTSESPIYEIADVDAPPKRMGCPHEAPAVMHDQVMLEYVVDEQGKVEPGSIRAVPQNATTRWGFGRPAKPASSNYATAQKIAQACTYEPALLSGEAVRVRLRHHLTF